jgi:hypothetical protein
MSWRSFGIVGATVAFVSQTAFAQAPPPPPPPPPQPTTEPPKEAPKETPKEAPKETPKEAPKERPADWVDAKPGEDKPAKPDEKDPNKPQTPEDQFGTEDDGKPAEKKATSRYFLGARFRDFVAPNFIFGLFADGGPDVVNVFSGGPEFMLNTGALEVIFSVTVPYADYSMDEFLFKAKSDPERAFEFASSSLKLITASVDLLGRIPIDDKGTVAFLIGGGVGISGVLGDIYRNQAYPVNPDDADPSDVTKWRKCKAPGDGNQAPDGGDYCGTDNDHYGEYSEPSWSDGGSKPIVFPYIALPHLALEVTPVEEFMVRLDTGFSITGFFFGLGGGGRLPI